MPSDYAYAILLYSFPVLSAIAEVNKAIDVKDPKVIISTLTDDDAHIANVEPDYAEKYLQALAATKEHRKRVSLVHFTWHDQYLRYSHAHTICN